MLRPAFRILHGGRVLSLGDARHAIELIKPDFISEKAGETDLLVSRFLVQPFPKSCNTVHLLPAFDEYIIAYRDRSASLVFEHHKKAVSDNGIFRPIIVINGRVKGIWKRTVKKDAA